MAARTKILLADDSNVVTTVLATALEREGFAVDIAVDGQTAYEKGSTGEYALAVLDQLMPGLLGSEIITRWKEEGVAMPVLILSGVSDDVTAIKSIEAGAVDFVRKPFHIPELVVRIKSRLPADRPK